MFGRIIKAVGRKALAATPAGQAMTALEILQGKRKVSAKDVLEILLSQSNDVGARLDRIEKRLDVLEEGR